MACIALIGGTGLEAVPAELEPEADAVGTRFGTVPIVRARWKAQPIIFLSRHGPDHGIAPHLVDYRANTAALVALGATHVLATNAVGSLRGGLAPGTLVLLDDFMDFTRTRGASYWDGNPDAPAGVVHTDFSVPYCPALRRAVKRTASRHKVPLVERGTYLCADGPRFESPAEVRMFARWGADVVGMTGLPEAVFAREAGLCYAALAIVTNYAAGVTPEAVDHEEVVRRMAETAGTVRALLLEAAAGEIEECGCTT